MTNVIELSDYRNKGNGAREALCRYLHGVNPENANKAELARVDCILAYLWTEGFKIVPLEPVDET